MSPTAQIYVVVQTIPRMAVLTALRESPSALARNPVLFVPVFVAMAVQLPVLLVQSVNPILASVASAVVSLLSIAAREGRPAGRAVVDTAEQLSELRTLEREARRELTSITRTLANTGAVFAPLVAGATVALAAGIPSVGGADAPAGSTPAASKAWTSK